MPIFEYKCPKCGSTTETLVLSSPEEHTEKCEKCGRRMKKVISLSSFHLKGKGWYATDYKDKDKKKKKKEKTEEL